ncbi:unnamed protein product [Mesocestoides corti]|uniref:BOWMAN_BIRK domain-containing protein n=1 Tax=Mesocestoides corti TaxID=53468 RepID=A0A0R3U9P9_MESCO|nr:unnamed protein product [Mesocestoides corti]
MCPITLLNANKLRTFVLNRGDKCVIRAPPCDQSHRFCDQCVGFQDDDESQAFVCPECYECCLFNQMTKLSDGVPPSTKSSTETLVVNTRHHCTAVTALEFADCVAVHVLESRGAGAIAGYRTVPGGDIDEAPRPSAKSKSRGGVGGKRYKPHPPHWWSTPRIQRRGRNFMRLCCTKGTPMLKGQGQNYYAQPLMTTSTPVFRVTANHTTW